MESKKMEEEKAAIPNMNLIMPVINGVYKDFETKLQKLPMPVNKIKSKWQTEFLPEKKNKIVSDLQIRYTYNDLNEKKTEIISENELLELLKLYVLDKILEKNSEKIMEEINQVLEKLYGGLDLNLDQELDLTVASQVLAESIQNDHSIIISILPKKNTALVPKMLSVFQKDPNLINLDRINKSLIVYYEVIRNYYKVLFQAYDNVDYYNDNHEFIGQKIKDSLWKVCQSTFKNETSKYETEVAIAMKKRQEDIQKDIIPSFIAQKETADILNFLKFYKNLKYLQAELFQHELKEKSKFDAEGLFISRRLPEIGQYSVQVLNELYKTMNNYKFMEATLYNSFMEYFMNYFVRKNIGLFDEKLLGGLENKIRLMKIVLYTQYDVSEEIRWNEFYDGIKSLIANHFQAGKAAFDKIMNALSMKDFVTYSQIYVALEIIKELQTEVTKWCQNVSKEQNLYAMFCLYVYLTQTPVQLTGKSNPYHSTSRLILRQIFRNLQNGMQRFTNFQLLCLLESLHEDAKLIYEKQNDKKPGVIRIKSFLNAIREVSITSDEDIKLHSQQRDAIVKVLDYKEPIPEHFFFEKLSSKKTRSRHIVICVSGYMSQFSSKQEEWNQVVDYFPHTEVFALHWSASSVQDILQGSAKGMSELALLGFQGGVLGGLLPELAVFESIWLLTQKFNSIKKNIWNTHYNEAQKTGKFLAHVLSKVKPFEDCCISLVGFSLGTVLVANCLWELDNLKCHNLIYDVMFMGGVASVNDFAEKGVHIVANRVINLYSKQDWIVKYLLKIAHWDLLPIGNNPIKHPAKKVVNYDKTEYKPENKKIGPIVHFQYKDMVADIMRETDFNEDFQYLLNK